MTGKLGDQGLDTLERRFQALRDQIGAIPEACRPELEGALQELSQAIARCVSGGRGKARWPKPTSRVKDSLISFFWTLYPASLSCCGPGPVRS